VVQVSGNTVRIQVEVDQLYGAPEVDTRQFVFDVCLGQDAGQDVVYEQVGDRVLQNALEGFNGTLFAYGQTGSGKSFSIMGNESNPGVIPRLINRLFEVVDSETREASEMRISVSFLEIYNEELKDLLDPRPRPKKLYVHQHPKLGVYVPHLTEAAAENAAECARWLDFGAKIRATAQTNMNSTSSRSHSVLTLRITQVFPSGKIRNSNAHLCDLAGSERVKKSGAQGKRMREGTSINNSLSVLGQVISKLAGGAERRGLHVPFRQSKLTYLLQDALSGNSVTSMVANVSPAQSEWEESLGTLRFAESVKKVRTKPQVMELAPEEPELLLETLSSEMAVLREALVKESTRCPSRSSQVAREIEASEHLIQSISARAGGQWAQAVEQTRALEAVQKQLLQAMSLPVQDVGHLVGVDGSTPYLLNISDDPALSGCLLYFLRPEPEASTVGQDAGNSIVLRGLGIPARLCEIHYRSEDKYVAICKVCPETDKGRLLVNGKPLGTGVAQELRHADRIVFGWAFCFRLVISGASSEDRSQSLEEFENVRTEVLEYSMSSSEMGMMRATAHWQAELQRRNVPTADVGQILGMLGELSAQLEEANALCSEVQDSVPSSLSVELDLGLCFSFASSSRPPTPVVQVWKRGEGRLLAIWPASDFDRRLNGLRDAHREALSREGRGRWALRLSREEWWAGESAADPVEPDAGQASDGEDAAAESEPALEADAASTL